MRDRGAARDGRGRGACVLAGGGAHSFARSSTIRQRGGTRKRRSAKRCGHAPRRSGPRRSCCGTRCRGTRGLDAEVRASRRSPRCGRRRGSTRPSRPRRPEWRCWPRIRARWPTLAGEGPGPSLRPQVRAVHGRPLAARLSFRALRDLLIRLPPRDVCRTCPRRPDCADARVPQLRRPRDRANTAPPADRKRG